MLEGCVAGTLAQLAYANLNWRDYCQMFAVPQYFGHGGSSGYTYNGAFRVHVHREPGFWSKEAVLDLRMFTGIFPSGYRPADRNTYTPVGWGAVAGIERAMDVESLTDADALLALQRIYDVRSDYGWARDDLELTDLQWCWCEERKFAAGVGFVLRETMRSYFCEESRRSSSAPRWLRSPHLHHPCSQPPPPPPLICGPMIFARSSLESMTATGSALRACAKRRGERL